LESRHNLVLGNDENNTFLRMVFQVKKHFKAMVCTDLESQRQPKAAPGFLLGHSPRFKAIILRDSDKQLLSGPLPEHLHRHQKTEASSPGAKGNMQLK
jgi:hypothetical protein